MGLPTMKIWEPEVPPPIETGAGAVYTVIVFGPVDVRTVAGTVADRDVLLS